MTFILQPWQLLLVILADWVNRQQQEVIEYLRTENQVLQEKLGKKRILWSDDPRRRLAVQGKILGRKRLAEIGTLFTPDTILALAPPAGGQEMGLQPTPRSPWAAPHAARDCGPCSATGPRESFLGLRSDSGCAREPRPPGVGSDGRATSCGTTVSSQPPTESGRPPGSPSSSRIGTSWPPLISPPSRSGPRADW